jgi:hypothetical protein
MWWLSIASLDKKALFIAEPNSEQASQSPDPQLQIHQYS